MNQVDGTAKSLEVLGRYIIQLEGERDEARALLAQSRQASEAIARAETLSHAAAVPAPPSPEERARLAADDLPPDHVDLAPARTNGSE